MIHKVELEWHDLKEDPNDLPRSTGWYIVTITSIKKGLEFYYFIHEALFDLSKKEWLVDMEGNSLNPSIEERLVPIKEYEHYDIDGVIQHDIFAWASTLHAYVYKGE